MVQEFNKVTTTSNFIKNLLISTYLPLIRTVRDFDYIIQDRLYVYKCEIIKCTKSGYIVTGFKNAKFDGERAAYRVISEYYFGEQNDKLCTNYVSNTEGYDSITHERLGKYLRSLRDMYDLNLMPLYNCFSNSILEAHHISNNFIWESNYDTDDHKTRYIISESKSKVEKTAVEYNTKIYKVPIRFNTDYTICMDNLGLTTFAPAFIKNNNLIKLNNTRFGNDVDATNKYIKLHRTEVILNKSNLRFNAPFVIRFNNIPETKEVTYFDKSKRKLDNTHNSIYYMENTPTSLPRVKYYIKNSGKYDFVKITKEDFEENPTNYFYSDDGIIVQCTYASQYSEDLNYYVFDPSSLENTYLPTNLTPETAGDTILFIGVEPATGRIDSTYSQERDYIWQEGDTLYTDILPDDPIKVWGGDETLYVEVDRTRIYDAPGFKIECLWEQCDAYHKYKPQETYYYRSNAIFYVWNYTIDNGEEEFNKNKTFFYLREGDEFVQCTEDQEYDASLTYYVFYNEEYITAAEYYFIMHTTSFYITNGFNGEPEKYYKLIDGQFRQQTVVSVFDMNSTYAIKPEREFYTWQVMDEEGNLIPSTDTYMVPGVTYYSKYDLETPNKYIYDITEENCALYDYLEDNLYLLIQVPKSYDSNILILEGDYTNTQSEKILDDSQVANLPTPLVDYLYTSSLKLMQMNSGKVLPFSETLMEFLLWNAINNLDSINNNMDRLFIAINKVIADPFSAQHFANYWYPQYRKIVSDIGRNYNNMVVTDNLGYVTRLLEQVIDTTANIESYINVNPVSD